MKIKSGWNRAFNKLNVKTALLQAKYKNNNIVDDGEISGEGGARSDERETKRQQKLDAIFGRSATARTTTLTDLLLASLAPLMLAPLLLLAENAPSSAGSTPLLQGRRASVDMSYLKDLDFDANFTDLEVEKRKNIINDKGFNKIVHKMWKVRDLGVGDNSIEADGGATDKISRCLIRDPYVIMVGKLHHLMVPPPIDDEDKLRCSLEDWERDRRRNVGDNGICFRSFLVKAISFRRLSLSGRVLLSWI